MKDNFSNQAEVYAQFRPTYPQQLFDYILQFVKEKNIAWDCGTGNGQSAKELSKYFETVLATDISQKQIDHAYQTDNIFYSIAPAENTSIPSNSIDLITVSQALHWFKFDAFYAEVKRVAKPGATIAVWTYSLLRVTPEIDAIIENYHYKTLDGYWEEERKYVDDGYVSIPFPFEQVPTPTFAIETAWTLQQLQGYLNTWSALQKFIASNHYNPVEELMQKIVPLWGNEEKRKVIFPIHIKLGLL